MDSLPNRIRELRNNACVTQQEIADHIGVTKTTVSELERGLLPFTLKYMEAIADCLRVAPADLLLPHHNPDRLSPEDRKLMKRIRSATKEQRETIERLIEAVLGPGA